MRWCADSSTLLAKSWLISIATILLAPGALDFAARYLTEHPEVDAIYSHRVFIDEENIVTRVLDPAAASHLDDGAMGLHSAGNVFLEAADLRESRRHR